MEELPRKQYPVDSIVSDQPKWQSFEPLSGESPWQWIARARKHNIVVMQHTMLMWHWPHFRLLPNPEMQARLAKLESENFLIWGQYVYYSDPNEMVWVMIEFGESITCVNQALKNQLN